jgi:beta-galactosidase
MKVRTDTAIATEQLGQRKIKDEADVYNYPFLTCELGGGMMSSYHRRIFMHPEDITAVALAKIGSGGNLPGYYMYHGGTNPEGRLTTLMEVQDTPMTNYNDLPVKNYDFQAPLGSFGQVRPHYHALRRIHLMTRDFGGLLAPMPSFLPDVQPSGKKDLNTLRWSVRSSGDGGFIFVNNHQRSASLPTHQGVQFSIKGTNGTAVIPAQAITIPADAQFFWPYRLDLSRGVRLESATAQPICMIDEGKQRTFFFAETPGIPANFTFSNGSTQTVKPGHDIAVKIAVGDTQTRIVLLDDADSLALWQGNLAGRDRVVLTKADAIFDSGKLRLRSENAGTLMASVYPPISTSDPKDGIFGKLALKSPSAKSFAAEVKPEKQAGPPRDIRLGRSKVAVSPTDTDFAAAATWRVTLPSDFDPAQAEALLRIHYKGDVARVKIGDNLVMDDFYNGLPLDVGLNRYADEIKRAGGLTIEILPFRADAPIFLPGSPTAGSNPMLSLDAVTVVPVYRAVAE